MQIRDAPNASKRDGLHQVTHETNKDLRLTNGSYESESRIIECSGKAYSEFAFLRMDVNLVELELGRRDTSHVLLSNHCMVKLITESF